jgi:hypothetical protein
MQSGASTQGWTLLRVDDTAGLLNGARKSVIFDKIDAMPKLPTPTEFRRWSIKVLAPLLGFDSPKEVALFRANQKVFRQEFVQCAGTIQRQRQAFHTCTAKAPKPLASNGKRASLEASPAQAHSMVQEYEALST